MRSLWDEIIQSRAFWISYVSASVDFAPCATLHADEQLLWKRPNCGISLKLSFPSDYAFHFEINPGGHYLYLLPPNLEQRLLLGTVDCHFMSDLMRWDEFEAMRHHLTTPQVPAWVCDLLLSPYVAVTQDCVDQYFSVLAKCLGESSVFSENEARHILDSSARIVRRDFRWIHSPQLGWIAEGEDAYSLRHAGNDEFDFALFRNFMAALAIP